MSQKNPNLIFFGTSEEAVYALEALYSRGIVPSLIITPTDRPAGRHQELKSPLAKIWAEGHAVPVFQPEKINSEAVAEIKEKNAEIFIVVGYGKILPKELIDLPKYKTLNIHTSLLPLYRGPTPIESPILNGDRETGVTIMVVDEKADHGPIVLQEKYALDGTETTPSLTKTLFTRGGELLADILPDWMEGKIKTIEQNHTLATYSNKLTKEDGLVNLGAELPSTLYNKFRAYISWPRIFFFQNNKRIIITDSEFIDNNFVIKKVLPEGRKEITWKEFQKIQ